MSTFEGKLLEDSLHYIRIDQFEPNNHDGTVFFLSHFHTDHFKGLFGEAFLKVLIENENKKLYCTPVTKHLIKRHPRCKIPDHKIIPLVVNECKPLYYEGQHRVVVRVLPAGHCPGSAMFLFEEETTTGTRRVLYTGDFRINPEELYKFKALHNSDGSLKKLHTLYLDTTFCDPRWISFPSRKQSEEDLIEIAQNWLKTSPDHKVGILYNSYHGLEHLLINVADVLKTKIHVRDHQSYENYACIPELHPALCQKESDSRVHLCSVKEMEWCKICRSDQINTKIIKPCAQSFTSKQLELGRQKEGRPGLVRIAYSLHCSLEELIGTVKYLKPDVVHPCALPRNLTEEQVLANLLLDVVKLKQELQEKSTCTTSPPKKRFCRSLTPEESEVEEEEEEPSTPDKSKHGVLFFVSCSDEEANKPLSQNSIDSPPL
ncbi:protein artemis-like isoform X1 [Macrosteles quadrilineatus]|uniref:protein artemis-like isoform X1 n=1 Tax=Macrosteles quadrilineatus TaxID=74068 RepID=UPI0023E11550|nr:protein artemis-like isoform X1 [Macrosteles quadrilineatus]XP_054285446.1 protein artemis-like isoform X1 [Macrosteles quadrilineatus]